MRKIFISLIAVIIVLTGTYFFYDYEINKTKKEYHKDLTPKSLNPESFISLFVERHAQNSLNVITLHGDFPKNWVKKSDVPYLISMLNSKEKCCSYMNIFSSYIPTEDAEVGGFAIIFMNSYISKTKINMGLSCSPKTDKEAIKKIENWYNEFQK